MGIPGFQTRRLVTFHRQDHDVEIRVRIHLLERQILSTRMPGAGKLRLLAVGQPLRVTGSVGTLPVQIRGRRIGAAGCERDRRPSAVHTGFRSFAGSNVICVIVSRASS